MQMEQSIRSLSLKLMVQHTILLEMVWVLLMAGLNLRKIVLGMIMKQIHGIGQMQMVLVLIQKMVGKKHQMDILAMLKMVNWLRE